MDDKWTQLQDYLVSILVESEDEGSDGDRCVDAQDLLSFMAELEGGSVR